MARLQEVRGLDVAQDVRFQERMWSVQRVTWVAVVILLAAAVLGVFGGSGPLERASLQFRDGAGQLSFDRFARLGAPTSVEIELHAGEGARNVAIARSWLDDYRVDGVLPQPKSVTALSDRYVFSFDVAASGEARLALTPRQAGRHRAVVWAPADTTVRFTQVVYP
jgi:hypothetical protein